MSTNMRIVAVERTLHLPRSPQPIDLATLERNGWPAPGTAAFKAINPPTLADTGQEKITAMDTACLWRMFSSEISNSPQTARDYWGLNIWVQLLANRGYAVLQPNFRGSTGYGRKHLHAGDRQWGLAMQDDLTDAVKWAVAEGIADPARIAIVGGSYGGYATLAGASFTPELYRCAVDFCGPSNLATLIKSFAPYWNLRAIWNARVGNPDDPADTELLRGASPLFAVEQIRIPMLIMQGANDVRVIQAESEQIVSAIEKNGGRVTYVVYSDEGHGLVRPANHKDALGRMEKFLADHLGGRYEPMDGDRVEGSSAAVQEIGNR